MRSLLLFARCSGTHVFGNTVVREEIQLMKLQSQKNRSRETEQTSGINKHPEDQPQNPIAYIDAGFGVPRDQSVHNAACVWIIGGRSVEPESCPNYEKHSVVINLIVAPCIFVESLKFINQRMQI